MDISYHKLKPIEVQCGTGVETDVQEDQCPFEEGVCGISLDASAVDYLVRKKRLEPPATLWTLCWMKK